MFEVNFGLYENGVLLSLILNKGSNFGEGTTPLDLGPTLFARFP